MSRRSRAGVGAEVRVQGSQVCHLLASETTTISVTHLPMPHFTTTPLNAYVAPQRPPQRQPRLVPPLSRTIDPQPNPHVTHLWH